MIIHLEIGQQQVSFFAVTERFLKTENPCIELTRSIKIVSLEPNMRHADNSRAANTGRGSAGFSFRVGTSLRETDHRQEGSQSYSITNFHAGHTAAAKSTCQAAAPFIVTGQVTEDPS